MKNKYWDLLFVFIGVINIAFSFRGNEDFEVVFGYELNIWIYRAIWAFITIGCYLSYSKKKDFESEAKDK
ncbi:hypothetical protein [uncultured Polaribacter sp.]|uniref:hypothetical protein n=1 Tax=uncultured Polaribacter sp. TaxID=174711 RepID=UPI0030DAA5AC|tara:strand:+ start:1731 stop:1940 length:210 start_codon:yes stop_codon:yes gene_type:complete